MGGKTMATYGVKTFEVSTGVRNIPVGFYYPEVIINLLDDAGSQGMTVRQLREHTTFSEQTIRNILRRYIGMNRVNRRDVSGPDNNLPNYRYYVKKRWLNIM